MNILADVKLGEKKTILSDEGIVQAFQLGDEVAFNLLVEKIWVFSLFEGKSILPIRRRSRVSLTGGKVRII